MTGLYITVAIVFGVVCSIGLLCYFDYKAKQFKCQEVCGKQNEEIGIKALELEIEKENTRQMELDSNAFRAKVDSIKSKNDIIKTQEETKQLQIKSEYRTKHSERLF